MHLLGDVSDGDGGHDSNPHLGMFDIILEK
jgi:hypothetical protein